jgi:hypothetical protein
MMQRFRQAARANLRQVRLNAGRDMRSVAHWAAWPFGQTPFYIPLLRGRRIAVCPLFATSILTAILMYVALWFYPTGKHPWLDRSISSGAAVALVVIALHMLYDRRLHLWSMASIGFFWLDVGAAALVSWLAVQRWMERPLSPGVGEGWLDVSRVGLTHGWPLSIAIIAVYWWQDWHRRKGLRAEPPHVEKSEQLLVAGAPDNGTERRSGELRRHDDRVAYRQFNEGTN